MAARAAWRLAAGSPQVGEGAPTTTVDGRWQPEIRPTENQFFGEGSEYPMIYEGFVHMPGGCLGCFSSTVRYKWG